MPITNDGVPFTHRDTSREAAESVADSVASLRAEIYRRILRAGDHGMTCDELEIEIGRIHESISARVWDLNGGNVKLQQRIEDSGARRMTRRKRRAIVWVVKKGDQQAPQAKPEEVEGEGSEDNGDVRRLVAEHDGGRA